jgi:hypothetical protein
MEIEEKAFLWNLREDLLKSSLKGRAKAPRLPKTKNNRVVILCRRSGR